MSNSSAALPYRIAGLDKLNLMVVNVPELTGIYRLDTTGSFSLPYIGVVKAAGRTPDEVASDIQVRLRDGYVNDPRVAVNIDQADSLNFSIDGQLNNPGEFAATPGLTLTRAVALAKGLNDYARLIDVVVFRTVKGERYAALYDLGAIRRGVDADPRIYPDDVVVVGDTAARRKLMQFVQALPLLTTQLSSPCREFADGRNFAPVAGVDRRRSPVLAGTPQGPNGADPREPPLRRIVRFVARWRWLLVAGLVGGLVLGAVLRWSRPSNMPPRSGWKSPATPRA